MFCEADGPEQRTTPFRPALDTVRTAPGLFRVNLRLDSTGVHKVNCYALNRGGINARYFNNRWVEGVPAISQVDTAIDFNWAEGLVTADSSDYASAQFDGYLQVPVGANYTFYITCDDGANLWIDDELVLSQATAGQYETRPILLTGSRLYHLQVMYYERTGFARMRLEWASDQGLVRQVIGKDSWYHSRSLLGLFPQTVLVFDKPGEGWCLLERFLFFVFVRCFVQGDIKAIRTLPLTRSKVTEYINKLSYLCWCDLLPTVCAGEDKWKRSITMTSNTT